MPNPLFSFLNQGLKETLPVMGEEKDMTYEGNTLKGYFNESIQGSELMFEAGGVNNTFEASFLIPQSELTTAGVTINKKKRPTLDGRTWKIEQIRKGPSATTLLLSDPNQHS